MRILLTNDDGIFAPGLTAIYKKLVKLGDVTVVAPADGQSGASHSITLGKPLVCNHVDVNGLFEGFSVNGSPADCVKLAVMQLYKDDIDLLVAGINSGANAGINVYYSGTVAAAMEGVFLNIPSVSMSLAYEDEMNFAGAADYCTQTLESLLPVKAGAVININIPQLSKGEPKGVRVVPQSCKGFEEYYSEQKDEQGRNVYQLTGRDYRDEERPTDITSLLQGYITVTALAPEMTDHDRNQDLKKELATEITEDTEKNKE
ncbi:5'/3'-nucleotidase SurE [Planctomycetota bacterium]